MNATQITEEIPRYKIEQVRIDDERGLRQWNLDAFAAEFGHRVTRIFPIFLVFIDGELSAYYYAQPRVCIYPAVNPRCFTPRSFLYVGGTIASASKKAFGNPLWIVSRDTPILTPERLKRVMLVQQPVNVFEVPE